MASIIADGPPPLAAFTYDPAGNRLTKAFENGVTTTYEYDDANRLGRIAHEQDVTSLKSFEYGYDSLDRRTSEDEDSGGADGYAYDAADQLTAVNYQNGHTVGYTYDSTGNRTQVDDSASGTVTYNPANALNQYSTISGVSALSYDPNGNLAAYGSATYAFDGQNRLVSGGGGAAFNFAYDASNRAVKRTIAGVTTYQIYDDWDLIAEYDTNGNLLAKYIPGPNTDEILARIDGSGAVYFHENGLGSTIALTDSNGAAIERYRYDAYGKLTFMDAVYNVIPISAHGNRFLFTGREWFGAIGFYDYRNRVYSPELGRFLQTDPIRFAAQDVNLYRYVSNNPAVFADPSGLVKVDFDEHNPMQAPTWEAMDDDDYKKTAGLTGFSGSVKCKCVNSCVECKVTLNAKIKLNSNYRGRSITQAKAYGHEQHHVVSMIEKTQTKIVSPLEAESAGDNCASKAKELQKSYNEKFTELRRGGDHRGDEGAGPSSPGAGKPYPPLDGSPDAPPNKPFPNAK